MKDEVALVPIDERTVDFYGDEIVAALVQVEGQTRVYVPLRPICRCLELSWSGQIERVKRDSLLSGAMRFVRFSRTGSGSPDLLCLPLELLGGWLFGIAPSRVKPEVVSRLARYRRECFRALWRVFEADLSGANEFLRSWGEPSEKGSLFEAADFSLTSQQIAERVRDQRRRAEKLGLPATLTLAQWLLTLECFGWKCAYCREMQWVVVEHFIPLSLGGGTTAGNCVPSCYACNSKKRDDHPDVVTLVPREVLDSIRAKLVSLSA